MDRFSSAQAIYQTWLTILKADLRTSDRLAHPLLQQLWEQFSDMGLKGEATRAKGYINLPPGESPDTLRQKMPGSHWSGPDNNGTICLLNRPAWLLGSMSGV